VDGENLPLGQMWAGELKGEEWGLPWKDMKETAAGHENVGRYNGEGFTFAPLAYLEGGVRRQYILVGKGEALGAVARTKKLGEPSAILNYFKRRGQNPRGKCITSKRGSLEKQREGGKRV